ncbi:MAG: S49 family peptidase, partial [Polyangiales bacterium]
CEPRLGVGDGQRARRGARAGATSMWRPFSADEQQVLRQKVAIWYRQFLARVAAGRGMSLAVVHKVAQGRVWSGDAALRVGLVDHLGGYAAALGRARKLAGLPVDAPVQVAPTRPRTLLEYLIKPGDEVTRLLGKAGDSRRIPVPAQLRQVLTFALTLAHTREGLPLAMMPAAYRAP